MGSYHIGLDRCLSAIVEANHDDKGIIWPINIAPYKVCIIVSNVNDRDALKYANSLYKKLEDEDIDTLLDDRKESFGVKFNDMELIGIPIILIVGKKLEENKLEIKIRKKNKMFDVNCDDIIKTIYSVINDEIDYENEQIDQSEEDLIDK